MQQKFKHSIFPMKYWKFPSRASSFALLSCQIYELKSLSRHSGSYRHTFLVKCLGNKRGAFFCKAYSIIRSCKGSSSGIYYLHEWLISMVRGGKYTSPMDPTSNLTTCIPFVCMSHPFLYCPLGCFLWGAFLVMDELWHSYMAFRRLLQPSCWYPVLRRLVTSSTWRRDKRHGDLVSVDYSREHEGNQKRFIQRIYAANGSILHAVLISPKKKTFDGFASKGTGSGANSRFVDLFSIEHFEFTWSFSWPWTCGYHKNSGSQNA